MKSLEGLRNFFRSILMHLDCFWGVQKKFRNKPKVPTLNIRIKYKFFSPPCLHALHFYHCSKVAYKHPPSSTLIEVTHNFKQYYFAIVFDERSLWM